MSRKIIIDTDPGQDDAAAIMLALGSPEEIDILGITTVAGNVPLRLTSRNARMMAQLMGKPGLPVFATLSFDTNLRTMMGVSPAMAVQAMSDMGVDVIGANCGRGLDEMRIIAAQLAEAGAGRVRLIVQSNAGLPKLQGDTFVFDGTPEEMAAYAVEMRDLGFAVIDACCGSSPAHIAAMRDALA